MRKKKKATEEQAGKGFIVRAVPYQKDFRKFAAELETTMNKLLGENYNLNTETHPQGILIMAQRHSLPQPENILEAVMDQLPNLSPEAIILLRRSISLVDMSHPESFDEILGKVTERLFRGAEAEKLRALSAELEEELRTHSDRCGVEDCNVPKLVAVLVAQIKRHMTMQLQ